MAGNGNLRVPIGIPVDTNAGDAADKIAELRDRITASKEAISQAARAMGDLKGKTAEVTAAKDQLQAKLSAERAAVAGMNAALVQQGTTYEGLKAKQAAAAAAGEKLAKAQADQKAKTEKAAKEAKEKSDKAVKDAKDAAKEKSDAINKGLGSVGGPAAGLSSKLDSLKDAFGGAAGGEAALAAGAAIAVAAVVAVIAAIGVATYALSKFIVVSADAARSQHLLRAAALNGNESWAKNLGDQVDLLARKVPLARDRINEIGISLAKNRIGGQVMVDTLNAVAQAASALGDDAGNKLKEFVERGRQMQRFQINPQELVGTGIDFDDVAKALAKSMHVGVAAARQALFEGRVKLADGAAALREAVEQKVGGINLRQMLSLENITKKAGEAFDALAKDVDLEPALKAIKDVISVFDQTTVTGRALKDIVTRIGKSLVEAFVAAGPFVKVAIQGLIIGALQLENAYLRVRLKIQDAFGDTQVLKNVDALSFVLNNAQYALYAVAAAAAPLIILVTALSVAVGAVVAVVTGLAYGFYLQYKAIKESYGSIRALDWKGLGTDLVNGFVNGIKAGLGAVGDAVGSIGTTAIKALKTVLDSHSPSRKMFAIGVDTTSGYAGGVDSGAPDAQEAVDRMLDVPSGGAGGGRSGGAGGPVSITFAPVIQLTGGGGSVTEQLADPALLQPLMQMFIQVLRSGGFEDVPA